ncbi:MAG: hypothetical protein COA58_06440 [Bacteroidetes bacterium]|nr:MAG: hypothetical protein COA58_06440 [Bacteroidota bacterium]
MQKSIKNIIKIIGFGLLLLSPFWICRCLLLFLNPELVITSLADYLFFSLRFDLKTLSIWYSPLFILLGIGLFIKREWWRNISRILFLIIYLGALVLGLIAILYYPISKNIVGLELFQLVKGQSLVIILGYMTDYWYAILGAFAVLYVALKWYNVTEIDITRKSGVGLSFVSVLVLVFFARGGIALKPLNMMDAYSGLEGKEAISAVTPVYVLIESFGKQEIIYTSYVDDEQILIELEKEHLVYQSVIDFQPNVCLIMLESFGKEYTGGNRASRPSYTPFLDSLSGVSLNYTNAYANGLRSMDAVASIMTGLPALMHQPLIGSLYTQSDMSSLPFELEEKGYTTSFFHAADEQSMSFKPFLSSKGLDRYYGRQQYPDDTDFDGTWGIFDEPFLSFFSDELSKQQEPWFSSVFTLSSHHPYKVPDKYNYLPKGTAEIHQSVGYTDNALRIFFSKASHQPWFENTVFILTADHTSKNETPEYQSYRGKYAIPLIVYAPKLFKPKQNEKAVQHIDVFTTIKHLAGVKNQTSAGKSLLDSTSSGIVHFDGNMYIYTNDSLTLEWNGEDKVKLYQYKKDPKQENDLSSVLSVETARMQEQLKISIQKYNYRLLNNYFQ